MTHWWGIASAKAIHFALLARNGLTNNLTLEMFNGTGSLGQQTVTNVLPTGQWLMVTETLTPGATANTNTSSIYINGQAYDPNSNPVRVLLQCYADDPFHTYRWDTSNAPLQVDSHGIYLTRLTAELVPEPATLVLLGMGAFALRGRLRRGRHGKRESVKA